MIMSTQTGATYLSKKYQALNTKSLIYGLNSTYKASLFIKYPTNIAPPIPLIGSKIFEAVKSRKSKKFLPKSINLSPTFSIFDKRHKNPNINIPAQTMQSAFFLLMPYSLIKKNTNGSTIEIAEVIPAKMSAAKNATAKI